MALFFTTLLSKARDWLILAGAIIVAVAAAYANGRSKGGRAARDAAAADKARSDLAAADNARQAVKERHEIEDDIARQPPGSAAERLRDDGWTRD